MRFIEKIGLGVYTAYCAVVFASLCLAVFPLIVLAVVSKNEKLMRMAHGIPRMVSRISLFMWGIKLKQHNRQLLAANEQRIFVFNHRSYLDAPVIAAIVPGVFKFIGKAEILSWPVLGYVLKHLYIPVQRKDKEQRKWAFEQLFVKQKSGASLIVLPEGTCNTGTDSLLSFKDGAFVLAHDTCTPMVVAVLFDTARLWPRHSLTLRPGTIDVHWLDEISSTQIAACSAEQLKEKVRELMEQKLQELRV